MSKRNNYSHLKLQNDFIANERYKFKSRFNPNREEEEKPKDHTYQRQELSSHLQSFLASRTVRHEKRSIDLSNHMDYVEIHFFMPFGDTLENFFLNYYVLTATKLYLFNKRVLFAIDDTKKFQKFIAELRVFINEGKEGNFNDRIKLIEAFYFFSSGKILESFTKELTYIELISEGLNPRLQINMIRDLEKFLEEHGVSYNLDQNANVIEASGLSDILINLIIDNFDIISKVNAPTITKITPSTFGQEERQFAFSILAEDDLPVIGVIDTGISDQTPLSPLIVNANDSDYDLTSSSVRIDTQEHGTAVGCLAAIGNRMNTNPGKESYEADAKLLSIKVLAGDRGYLQRSDVVRLIRKAHIEYGIRIFTLTITENNRPKNDNEELSKYAFLLDQLTAEIDILIFISIGNCIELYDLVENKPIANYPKHFDLEISNLETPSDSYNNVTVGAIADNFEENDLTGVTPDKTFPAIYTRTHNFKQASSGLSNFQKNKGLFKPDIVFQGGDFTSDLFAEGTPALSVMASKINFDGGVNRNCGTSFSAPLAANLAAKIISVYPNLDMQTVKALMINNASNPWGTRSSRPELKSMGKHISHVVGHGIPNSDICLFSNEDEVIIILENSIELGNHKVIPIRVPKFLLSNTTSNVLELEGTLCYKFNPIPDNQMGYCPYHISFGVFKDEPLSDRKNEEVQLKKTAGKWSEDYYFKAKMLSNVQRFRVNISKNNIQEENGQFRIGIRSKVNRILPKRIQDTLKERPCFFSLVLKIKDKGLNGKLYSELKAINNLEMILDMEGEIEATN